MYHSFTCLSYITCCWSVTHSTHTYFFAVCADLAKDKFFGTGMVVSVGNNLWTCELHRKSTLVLRTQTGSYVFNEVAGKPECECSDLALLWRNVVTALDLNVLAWAELYWMRWDHIESLLDIWSYCLCHSSLSSLSSYQVLFETTVIECRLASASQCFVFSIYM